MTDWNKIFNSVCKVVFKDELGNLAEYKEFLTRYVSPVKSAKSSISDKTVFYSDPFCVGSKLVSFEEANNTKIEPIKMNELKDIDLLINAVGERFQYSGNKITGNCEDIEESEGVVDSFHIYRSYDIMNCENLAYCQMLKKGSKFSFGCSWGDAVTFCINATGTTITRSFETGLIVNSSDAYFSYNCNNCIDIMFCFNQRSINYAIGNTVLEKNKYLELKKKLLEEIVYDLKRKKTFPTLAELCFGDTI